VKKTNAIEKDNELLLGRLVEISRKKPGVLASVKSETSLPRTLNGPSRRREKNRIAAENEAFARRLLSQQPSFNPKKLEVDYEKHNQRVKNMAKQPHFSPRKVRLPPIKYADFDNSNKDGKVPRKYYVKKDLKKKVNDVEVDDKPKSVSPVKVQGKENAPVKPVVTDSRTTKKVLTDSPTKNVVTDSHIAKNEGANDSQVDNKPVENPVEEVLNIPADDQKQPTSAVNVDNKSQVLQDNQVPKSGTNHDQVPKSGTNHDQVPKSETNHDQVPKSGTNQDQVPKSGTNQDQVPKSGTNQDQVPKSGTNHDQVPKSGTNLDQKGDNNNSPNSAVVDQKAPEDKPVEEDLPEQIQDDTKEATA